MASFGVALRAGIAMTMLLAGGCTSAHGRASTPAVGGATKPPFSGDPVPGPGDEHFADCNAPTRSKQY